MKLICKLRSAAICAALAAGAFAAGSSSAQAQSVFIDQVSANVSGLSARGANATLATIMEASMNQLLQGLLSERATVPGVMRSPLMSASISGGDYGIGSNMADLSQIGDNNMIDLRQSGSNNYAWVRQEGNSHVLRAVQNGSGNFLKVSQSSR